MGLSGPPRESFPLAEQLATFDFGRRAGQMFPDEWFNGSPWVLEQGPDFQMKLRSFQACYSRAARARDMFARSEIQDEKTIVVQALEARPNGKG